MDATLHMPILLEPMYKEYIWGGDRLLHEFHRRLNPGIYAEAWEISDHPDGRTRILNGPDAGATLSEAIARRGPDLLGNGRTDKTFPLLVKIIDARETLSVQVHPDDDAAARLGGEAKSEMWYVLSSTPDAHIYSGFKPGVTPADFEKARAAGTIPALLQRFRALPGMVFNTPADASMPLAPDASCSKSSRTQTPPIGCTTGTGWTKKAAPAPSTWSRPCAPSIGT